MSTVTYIFLATLFYVANPDIKENLYSYQVQFGNMEQCEQFFIYFDPNAFLQFVYKTSKVRIT